MLGNKNPRSSHAYARHRNVLLVVPLITGGPAESRQTGPKWMVIGESGHGQERFLRLASRASLLGEMFYVQRGDGQACVQIL